MQPIKMTNLFERLASRLSRLAAVSAITLALAACGPGTGGTGTGPIAATLGFTGGTGASATTPGAGCVTDCTQASLRLDTERVELAASCLRFVYTGTWGVDAGGLAVLSGTAETGGTTAPNAVLRLQFSDATAASAQVTLTLTDSAGRSLLGSVALLRNDAALAVAPPACQPQ